MAFKIETASGELFAGFDAPRAAAPRLTPSPTAAPLDAVLQRWLRAADATHAAALLEELLTAFDPLIREIVSFQLRFSTNNARHPEGEDVCAEARLRLLTRLIALRDDPGAEPIHNLRSYVAVTAYRACYESLRRQYPQRYSLKHKLRVLLRECPEFTAWESAEGWQVGLSAWPHKALYADASARLADLRANPPLTREKDLAALLRALLQQAAQPLALESIVGLIAEWWEIKDHPTESLNEFDEDERGLLDPQPSAARSFDQRAYLTALWQEVAKLTPPQRAALLLNLREGQGGNAAELWLFTGIATFGQLAAALALSEPELAQLWNGLPLDDLTIAARLGLARQQIINLRKVARARLVRQMRERGF